MEERRTIFSAATVVMAAFACLLMMTAVATAQMDPIYAVREISIVPNPPKAGEPTEICCEVHNPTDSPKDMQLQFSWDELGIGLSFNPINGLRPVHFPPHSVVNECIYWIPPLSGPFSIQVEISLPGYETVWAQNNLDIDASLLPGVPGSRTFKVGNPTGSTADVTLGLIAHLPNWSLDLSQDTLSNMAPGSEQTVTLTVTPPATLPQDGAVIVDVEGFIAGELIGGFRKIYRSGTVTTTTTTTPATTTTLPGNTQPSASFTVSPSSGDTSTLFSVNASGCSDAEDSTDMLEVRWDWESDGVWDTGFSPEKTANHYYESDDNYTIYYIISLEVIDSEGLTDTAIQEVQVISGDESGNPPTASFTVDPAEGDTSTTFDVDASESTDDGEFVEVHWDWEGDGMWDTGFAFEKTASHSYETGGLKTIILEVIDADGLTDATSREVMVTGGDDITTTTVSPGDNTPPEAVFFVDPPEGNTNTEFEFNATGCNDLEDISENLEVRWDWEGDDVWDTGFSPEKTASHTYDTSGLKTVILEVIDTGGLTGAATQEVMVNKVQSWCPVNAILGGNDQRVDALRRFRDNILSKSPEGQELIRLYYEWSPVIVKAMEKDKEFRGEVKELIDGVLGVVVETE